MKTYLLTTGLLVVTFWLAFLYWTAHPLKPTRQSAVFGEVKKDESTNSSHDGLNTNELTTEEMKNIIGKRDPFRRMK